MAPRGAEAEAVTAVVALRVEMVATVPQEVVLPAPAAVAVALQVTQEVATAVTAALTAAVAPVQMHQARATLVARVEKDI